MRISPLVLDNLVESCLLYHLLCKQLLNLRTGITDVICLTHTVVLKERKETLQTWHNDLVNKHLIVFF